MPERGDGSLSVREICENYIDTVAELERNRKIGEGIFGLKGGPKDSPCHDRFIEDLAGALKDLSASGAGPEEIREVLSYLYRAPLENKNQKSAYWMLLAAHGLTFDLIDCLTPEGAAALYDRYAEDYPRWERLPVQKNVLSRLKDRKKGQSR